MFISGKECARARESVSAELDRELQELDIRRLRAHLRICADCSAWAGHVRATTAQLREAPFETPPAPVAMQRRRSGRAGRVGAALVVAPAAALAASVVFSLGVVHHGLFGNPRTTSTSPRTSRNFVQNSPDVDMYRLPALQHMFRAI